MKRFGSFLEESVEVIFKKAGFRTKRNAWINGYEVDVLALKGAYKIGIECKHYERSRISFRNLIHQWASKNHILQLDKIIIAIAGQRPSREDYYLANSLGIILIDDEKLHTLNSLDSTALEEELNFLIKLDREAYISVTKKRILQNLAYSFGFIGGIVLILFLAPPSVSIPLVAMIIGVLYMLNDRTRKGRRKA